MKPLFKLSLKITIVAISVACFLPGAAVASEMQTHVANQSTIAWNAVSRTVENKPIPAGDVVKYNVYIKYGLNGVPQLLTEVAATRVVLTFESEGEIFAGVAAVRYVDLNKDGKLDAADTIGGKPYKLQQSEISWSEDALPPFRYLHFVMPAKTEGLEKKQEEK